MTCACIIYTNVKNRLYLRKMKKKPKILMQLLTQGDKVFKAPNITIDNALNRHLSKAVRKLFTCLVYK